MPMPNRDSVGYRGGEQVLAAWLPPVTSDDEGRFTLRGIPASHGVLLNVIGSDYPNTKL